MKGESKEGENEEVRVKSGESEEKRSNDRRE